MSYEKAVNHSIRASKKQANNHFGFSALASTERRVNPWLGAAWFAPGQDEEREKYIQEYEAETARMLRQNPCLKLI